MIQDRDEPGLQPVPEADAPERPDRRAVLEKLGALGYYTPPVMMTLMFSTRASACSMTPNNPNDPPCDPGTYGGF